MNLKGQISAGMAKISKTVKNGADNWELDGKIAEQKNKIKGLKKEILNLVMVRLDAGDEMYPEIMERYAAILKAKEAIEALEKERKTTKTVCPNCGAKTSVEMNYCGQCGVNINEE